MEFLLCMDNLGDYDSGDIIDIRADGFNWGSGERNNSRFKIVRIADAELGDTTPYLHDSICKCELCNKLMGGDSVEEHITTEHADVMYEIGTNPPMRKSPEQIGIRRFKNRKWVVDGQGFGGNQAEICEKVFVDNDTDIAFRTEKTVDVVIVS